MRRFDMLDRLEDPLRPLPAERPRPRLVVPPPDVIKPRQEEAEAHTPELLSRVTRGQTQPVQDGFVPKKHSGFWDRLKSIGEGAVLGLPYGLGGAVAGATIGGISPQRIDLAKYRQQQERELRDQQQQLGIEKTRAEIQKLKYPEIKKPDYETREDEQGNLIRQVFNPQTGLMEDVLKAGQPDIVRRPNPKAERQPIFKTKRNADGSESTMQSDDNGKTWRRVEDLESAAGSKGEGEDYRTLADWSYKKQKEAESYLASIEAKMKTVDTSTYEGSEELKDLREQRKAALADIQKYRDEGDKAAVKVKGKNSQIQLYADQFFGGDYAAAEAAIKKQRGQ